MDYDDEIFRQPCAYRVWILAWTLMSDKYLLTKFTSYDFASLGKWSCGRQEVFEEHPQKLILAVTCADQ